MEPALRKTSVQGRPWGGVLDDLENKKLYMFWKEKNQISSRDYLFNLLCPEYWAGLHNQEFVQQVKEDTEVLQEMVLHFHQREGWRSPRQLSSSDLELVARPSAYVLCQPLSAL